MLKRKIGIALVAAALGAFAGDNTIKLVYRTDLRTEFCSDTAVPTNSQFDIQYLRVDFKGNVTDNMKYRLRLRLDKTSIKDGLAGASAMVNYAFIEPKFGEHFSFDLGKLWNYEAGWENDNSSSDVYVFTGMDDITNSYVVGISPTLTFGDQGIHLVVANSGLSNEKDTKVSKYFNMVLAYQGKIGIVQPLLSVEVKPEAVGNKGEFIGDFGLKIDPKKVGGEVDVGYWKSTTSGADSTNPSLLSFSGTLRINAGKIRPQLKALYDINSLGSNQTGSVVGFAPALEIYPKDGADFRIHLAYTGKETMPKNGTNVFDQNIYLGVKGAWSIK